MGGRGYSGTFVVTINNVSMRIMIVVVMLLMLMVVMMLLSLTVMLTTMVTLTPRGKLGSCELEDHDPVAALQAALRKESALLGLEDSD